MVLIFINIFYTQGPTDATFLFIQVWEMHNNVVDWYLWMIQSQINLVASFWTMEGNLSTQNELHMETRRACKLHTEKNPDPIQLGIEPGLGPQGCLLVWF